MVSDMSIQYGSVCSGIEAASVAWESLGWQPAWFAEVEAFPSAVLAQHWPNVKNHGDMIELPGMVERGAIVAPDVLVGGTPCQAFSVAGKRGSLSDERGALTLAFVELANAIDNRRKSAGLGESIIVWENVPGVLNTKDNAFGCFLGALAGESCELQPAGKRWTNAGCVFGPQRAVAWRVLDAQYFGVAQRRRRVFVVASARDGFDPCAVLFESEGVRRDSAPSREAGEEAAGNAGRGASGAGCWWDGGQVSQTLDAVLHKGQTMPEKNRFPAVLQTVSVHGTQDPCVSTERTHTLGRNNGGENAVLSVAFDIMGTPASEVAKPAEVHVPLRARAPGQFENSTVTWIAQDLAVRRLTTVECERLQGFPDGHTGIPDWYACGCGHNFSEELGKYGCPNCEGDKAARLKKAADGPRYKAIGNSMAVPVMRWIGERVATHICGGG